MDTDTLPPIRPHTNEKEDRKAAGFLPSLLSKLGLGGTSSGGLAASSSRGAGSALWGALLGTKAGLVALILAGTTIAAGIGVVGKRAGFFGGGSEGRLRRGLLFSGSRGGAPAGSPQLVADPDGVSSSLDMFVHANRGQGPDGGDAAPEGGEASGAAPSTASSSPAAEGAGPDNTNAPANTGSPQGQTAGGARLGPFKGFGGAAGGVSGGGFFARGPGSGSTGAQGAAGSGRISAMRKSSKAPVVGGGRTAIGRVGRRALNQAAATNRAVRGNLGSPNISSQGSGVTYDGGRAPPAIGSAGAIDGGGIGTGGAGVNQGVKPNQSAAPRDLPAPPPIEEEENATPWQWAIYAAMGAMAVALIAFMAMSYFKNKARQQLAIIQAGGPAALAAVGPFMSALSGAKWAGAIATLAGTVATVMGVLIMTTYGQMGQGLIWTAVGGLFTMMAAMQWFKLPSTEESKVQAMAKLEAAQIAQNPLFINLKSALGGGGGGLLGFGG